MRAAILEVRARVIATPRQSPPPKETPRHGRTREIDVTVDKADITGLVLCGGRGSRMGGVDKGLQMHGGQPLALHALRRLAPQVSSVMVSANRNLDRYSDFGAPVWPDDWPGYPGPLAGWLAGLSRCNTPWMLAVPCDSPAFPLDLGARLSAAVHAAQVDIAMAATAPHGVVQPQPAFCLLRATLQASLRTSLGAGRRQASQWAAQHHMVQVVFDDEAAFFNANTQAELRQLQPTQT